MSKSRNKGRAYEYELARELGAKRQILSGAVGGNDLVTSDAGIWADWGIEAKRLKELPAKFRHALDQAEGALPRGSRQRPAVVTREDRGRSVFIAYLDDVRVWAEALNEIGNRAKIKTLIRQLERGLQDLKSAAG